MPAQSQSAHPRPGLFQLDPLEDTRWRSLTEEHPQATVFHTVAWLRTLRLVYGYRPLAWTSSPPGEALRDGLPACWIQSRWTGQRLVSLPFSDHCDPLAPTSGDPVSDPVSRVTAASPFSQDSALLNAMRRAAQAAGLQYAQARLTYPLSQPRDSSFAPHSVSAASRLPHRDGCQSCSPSSDPGSDSYCWHRLDLRPGPEELFSAMHPTCIRSKVRRARREGMTVRQGGTALLDDFYRLLIETRRRHGLPPQPRRWFRVLAREMGDRFSIRLALHQGRPAAALLLLRHGSRLVYKYGCSHAAKHRLGSMPFLFWETIQAARAEGTEELDLGRTDWAQTGLVEFKDRLGARRWHIVNVTWPSAASHQPGGRLADLARRTFTRLPDPLLVWAGRILYPHMG